MQTSTSSTSNVLSDSNTASVPLVVSKTSNTAESEPQKDSQNVVQKADSHSELENLTQNAAARDKALWQKKKPSTLEYLTYALSQCGRSPFSVLREYSKLSRGQGRMTFPEYVQFGLYDPDMPFERKQRFISNKTHWPITHKCCDMTWQATTEDKWLCSRILKESSVPVPETLAVVDKTNRIYPGTITLSNAEEFREFALEHRGLSLFGKENRGMAGFGVFLIDEIEEQRLHLKGEGWIEYESFFDKYIGNEGYLIQPAQRNHAFFEKYTDGLATVRVCILVTDAGIRIPFAVLKLPARDQIADSFWRSGNLACKLDPATGKILDARTKSPLGTESFENCPSSGEPLVNETLPQWEQLLDLVHDCAPIFSSVRYQSMDVAITDEGPKLIEINTGGGFDLPQLASGEGFLTDEVIEFFKSHGCKGF